MTSGSRNLILLGAAATFIALLTTGISLVIYHSSGDIYFDRSRPGYLPDDNETSQSTTMDDFSFSDTGPVSSSALEDYLTHLDHIIDSLDEISDPFPAKSLSDDSLGIPSK